MKPPEGAPCDACGRERPLVVEGLWWRCQDCADAARRPVCRHYRRGPLQRDDSQACLDCGVVIVSDG